jgi:NifU-like protein involved in Fe-S cluster formation
MFSETVLDHFNNPRNAGELLHATHIVEVSKPVCGDILRLAARIEGGRIVEARFLCRGCTTAIAAASVTTEMLQDAVSETASKVTASAISRALGDLPPATFHGAQLAASAVVALLTAIRRS